MAVGGERGDESDLVDSAVAHWADTDKDLHLRSFVAGAGAGAGDESPPDDRIHIFSIASGHLYER